MRIYKKTRGVGVTQPCGVTYAPQLPTQEPNCPLIENANALK